MTTEKDPVPERSSLFDKLIAGLSGIGTVVIFALMVLINLDVVSRTAFNSPINGVPEIVELSIVGIVFLQLAHCLKSGRITRSDGFYNRLKDRRPRAASALGVGFNLTGAILFAFILYGSVPRFVDSWNDNWYVGNVGLFTAPVWPVTLIILIGCAAMTAQFLRLALSDMRGLRRTAADD